MKNLFLRLLAICIIAIAGCKKKESIPTIVGQWILSDISGATSVISISESYIDTFSFDKASKILTKNSTLIRNFSTIKNVSTTTFNEERWTFNTDGTYAIKGTYTATSGHALTHTSSGTWEYGNNTRVNSSLYLLGIGSQAFLLFGSMVRPEGPFVVESITDKLVLKKVFARSDSYGSSSSVNMTFTFIKQ